MHSEFFGDEVTQYAATPSNVALSPGHTDITRFFFRGHQSRPTGNHLDRDEKIPNAFHTNGTVEVFDPRSGISGPISRRAPTSPDLHE